jgi:hypothetical protein
MVDGPNCMNDTDLNSSTLRMLLLVVEVNFESARLRLHRARASPVAAPDIHYVDSIKRAGCGEG